MKDNQTHTKILEPIWRAVSSDYCVECYDFQLRKKSDPPPLDADPVILQFKDNKKAP